MRSCFKNRYEWVVTACCFLFLFVNVGFVSTSFSVYQPYLAALEGVGDVGASTVLTVRTTVSLLALLVVDRLLSLLDVRRTVSLACAFTGAGFLCYGLATGLSGLVAGAVLAGLGNGLGAMVCATVLLNRWFDRGVGTAIGFASVGSGVAGVVVPLVATVLIAKVSLAASFMVEGAFSLAAAAVVLVVVRNRPQDIGTVPHATTAQKVHASEGRHGLPDESALPAGARAGVYVAVFMYGAVSVGGMAYLAILLTSKGLDAAFAAGVLSLGAAFLIISKIATGRAFDRFGGARTTGALSVLLVAGLACFCLATPQAAGLAVAGAALYSTGLSLGSVGISVWSIDFSSASNRASSVKGLQVANMAGGVAFNLLPGVLKALTGTYVVSYALMLAGVAVGAVLVLRAYVWRERILCGSCAAEAAPEVER